MDWFISLGNWFFGWWEYVWRPLLWILLIGGIGLVVFWVVAAFYEWLMEDEEPTARPMAYPTERQMSESLRSRIERIAETTTFTDAVARIHMNNVLSAQEKAGELAIAYYASRERIRDSGQLTRL